MLYSINFFFDIFHLNRTLGTEDAKIRLYWNSNSEVLESSKDDLVIAHYNSVSACWEHIHNDTADFTKNTADDGTLGTLGYIETEYSVSSFSPFAFASRYGNLLLPVELLYFTASLNDAGTVDLDWATVSEAGNDYFEIQRKRDGQEWQTIDVVESAGESTVLLSYEYEDELPLMGISHYRLKLVELDGTISYSSVSSVEITQESFQYQANYIDGNLIVQLETSQRAAYELRVYDITGKVVYNQPLQTDKGLNKIIIPKYLQQAMYLVELNDGIVNYNQKVIVR